MYSNACTSCGRAAYLQQGGRYLGLCAGAYYACQQVAFEPGTNLEVHGNRELALFPGVAVGSIVPGFEYGSELGAQVCAAAREIVAP